MNRVLATHLKTLVDNSLGALYADDYIIAEYLKEYSVDWLSLSKDTRFKISVNLDFSMIELKTPLGLLFPGLISVRLYNRLQEGGIPTVEHFLCTDERTLKSIRNFGKTCLSEAKELKDNINKHLNNNK